MSSTHVKRNMDAPASKRGFTLIELLVVIAIIGILAALVLVALGLSRPKANDARVKSNLSQLRLLTELHYDANGSRYDGVAECFGTTSTITCLGGIANDVTALRDDNSEAGASIVAADNGAQDFCLSSTLISDSSSTVCVDATGRFLEGPTVSCVTSAPPPSYPGLGTCIES